MRTRLAERLRAAGGPALLLARQAPPGRVAVLLVLMLLTSLSEGVGLVMLVPLLAALDTGSAAASTFLPGAFGVWLDALPLAGLLGIFVLLIALRSVLLQARLVRGVQLERGLVAQLRGRLLRALLHAEWGVANAMGRGTMMARLHADIDRTGYGIHQLAGLFSVTITGMIALAAAFVLSARVALAIGLCGVVIVLLHAGLRRLSVRLGRELTEGQEKFHDRIGETLSGLRLIKQHRRESAEAGRVAVIEQALAAGVIRHQRLSGLGRAALQTGGALVLALVVWVAVVRWAVPPLVLLPLVAVFARLLPLLGVLQNHWEGWLFVRPSVQAVMDTIATLEASGEPPETPDDAETLGRPVQAIAVLDATLLYPERDQAGIAGVSCVLPVGSLTLLAGPSGAGKSTLADVLAGLAVPQQGAILLDGVPLPAEQRQAWRRHVAYMPQNPWLFSATIRENLLWAAPDADTPAIYRALRDASADFVLGWPEGLDTKVGDDGRQLSGGERQRIALARCLLLEPALLILDEPASALDPENASAVMRAVEKLRGRLTMLVISHDDGFAASADQTLHIVAGRMVAMPLTGGP